MRTEKKQALVLAGMSVATTVAGYAEGNLFAVLAGSVMTGCAGVLSQIETPKKDKELPKR